MSDNETIATPAAQPPEPRSGEIIKAFTTAAQAMEPLTVVERGRVLAALLAMYPVQP
jgi:hypothetical protein